jgi:hypothetical protein
MNQNFESQLEQLQQQINDLKNEADRLQKTSPKNAVTNARTACEAICKHICMKSGLISSKGPMNFIGLSKMIWLIEQNEKAPPQIIEDMRFIQKKGNIVVHSAEKINPEDATPVLYALTNLVNWYFSGTTARIEEKEKINPKEKPEEFVKQENEAAAGDMKGKIRSTFKKQWFNTAAAAVMAATGTAIAAKILKR